MLVTRQGTWQQRVFQQVRCWRRYCAALLCGLALLAVCGSTHAAYEVEVDAPWPLKKLLKDHLDLYRFSKRTDISQDQLGFLVTAAFSQANDLLRTQGYFSAIITTDMHSADMHSANPKPGAKKKIIVMVQPGERAIIRNVDLSFTGPIKTEDPALIDVARAAWTLQPGAPFTQDSWDDAKAAVLKALQTRRYLSAHIVSSDASINPRTHSTTLRVEFASGPTFTFGNLELSGMKRYPQKIVDNINPIHPGQIYDAAQLQELQRQIQATPYYANAAIYVDNDPQHAQHAPIHVKLSEYPYHNLQNGIGYSTDTGPSLQTNYQYNDIFDKAWVFSAQGVLQRTTQNGVLTLAMPPDTKGYVNRMLASYTRTDFESAPINSLRIGGQRSRSWADYDWLYSVTYYRDKLTQNAGAPSTSWALMPAWEWVRRNIDDPLFPSRGNVLQLQAGAALKNVASDASFVRLALRGKQYIPLDATNLLIFRGEFGGVLSTASSRRIPASLLFRAGGSDTVRGYTYDSIGNNVAGSVLPVKYLAAGGVEYQHWFAHQYGGAAFYDVGTATDNWSEKKIRQGVGIGARWRSPIGPVNFDLAYGLNNHSFKPYITLGVAF